jgi:hypothetical protein
MMQTDVLNASLTASGQLFTGRSRIRQILFVGNTTAGSITIYDNTTGSGRVVWSINFHTSNVPCSVDIPGEGMLCLNGAYAVLSNVVGMSISYA